MLTGVNPLKYPTTEERDITRRCGKRGDQGKKGSLELHSNRVIRQKLRAKEAGTDGAEPVPL